MKATGARLASVSSSGRPRGSVGVAEKKIATSRGRLPSASHQPIGWDFGHTSTRRVVAGRRTSIRCGSEGPDHSR
jgi:hypothetical protein